LETLTGQSIEDVLNGLAGDVGLENTALPPADMSEMPPPASAGYFNDPAAAELQAEGIDVGPLGDVSEYTATWAGGGGSMYSNVEDLGAWAATGFGNALLPADLGAQRLDAAPIDLGVDYGLGIVDYGNGWYGHAGEILGWNSLAVYQPDTGAIFVAIVNESGSLLATAGPALAAFPDLLGPYGLG
jgi:D-alanyl-D-alanine carboxypeptidase